MRKHLWLPFLCAGLTALFIINCGSDSPTQPTKTYPDITLFEAAPVDIVPGDSVTLAYAIKNATQARLYPGGQVLASAVSGSIKVGPQLPTKYSLVATNPDGKDSAAVTVTMSTVVPSITSFDLTVDTILIGDSTQIIWQAVRADSIVVNSGVGKLSSAVSGTTGYLKPSVNTAYRAIAYNQYGTDTATLSLRVEVPARIDLPNGNLFRGTMGSSISTPDILFAVYDAQSQLLKKPWVHFARMAGDGQLSTDSAKPDAAGMVHLTYNFSGNLGYTIVRATIANVDTVDISVRADVFVPGGTYPQGQYILVGDLYSTVKWFNGNPTAVNPDPRSEYLLNYATYENTLGLTFMIQDDNDNNVAENDEPVYGIIVDSLYTRKTKDGIGVGSTIAEVQAIYGVVSGILDPNPPAAYHYDYPAHGLTFWTDLTAERKVFEIHIKSLTSTLSGDGGRRPAGIEKAR